MFPHRVETGGDPLASFVPALSGPALTHAFSRRAPLLPWRGVREVAKDRVADRVRRLEQAPRTETTVAYVHVPFCHNHCLFCGFYRNAHDPERYARFVDLLIADLERSSRLPMVADGPAISAVYMGGGTPTALAAADIGRLVAALRRNLPLAPDCEITLEGRTHGLDDDRIDAALDAGVTRISLGVQSLDTRVRHRLGRKFDRAGLIDAIERLVARDRATVVIDLMYGLPGQTADVWRRDIETAADLGLDGLDFYALSVWPGGPLAQAITGGKALPLPSLADQGLAYAEASAFFAEQGWRRLSQAHVARSLREENRYNRLVKAGAACLAFGPGAGGSGLATRWSIDTNLETWSAAVEAGRSTIGWIGDLSATHDVTATITAAMEEGLLDLAVIETRLPGFRVRSAPLIAAWEAADLARCDGSILATTLAGDFWMTTLAGGLLTVADLVAAEARA